MRQRSRNHSAAAWRMPSQLYARIRGRRAVCIGGGDGSDIDAAGGSLRSTRGLLPAAPCLPTDFIAEPSLLRVQWESILRVTESRLVWAGPTFFSLEWQRTAGPSPRG